MNNNEMWNLLNSKGIMYSIVKDGAPDTAIEKIIGFGYPLVLLLLIILNVAGMVYLIRLGTWRWKTFIASMSFGCAVGWISGIWMLHFDPAYPAWVFPPWACTGVGLYQTIEDWLFYPACTMLFYVFYRVVKVRDTWQPAAWTHPAIISMYIVLSIISLMVFTVCGRAETVMFMFPGIFLYIYARKVISLKKFLYFQIFVIPFQTVWDLAAVSWIHSIPGWAWASQWVYISFDCAGNYFHSKVFLDYATHHWDWLFYNPVEITPWFGICGGLLDFVMFAAGDTFFYRSTSS